MSLYILLYCNGVSIEEISRQLSIPLEQIKQYIETHNTII